ncbi:hypothetical protein ACS0TY_011649 [Phlomoides rotata]
MNAGISTPSLTRQRGEERRGEIGLKRTISDHALVLLVLENEVNWGPKPFKIVNSWLDKKDFKSMVNSFGAH